MTRGRRPLLSLKEAYGIAVKRGQVLPVFDGRYDHFHFILFTEDRVIFIKVKRTLSNKSDPEDVLDCYERDIRHIAQVPLNTVDAREFWARSPRGDFFFFRVKKETIIGIQSDGSEIAGAEYPLKPEKQKATKKMPEDPAADKRPDDRSTGPVGEKPVQKPVQKKDAPRRKAKGSTTRPVTGAPVPDRIQPDNGTVPDTSPKPPASDRG